MYTDDEGNKTIIYTTNKKSYKNFGLKCWWARFKSKHFKSILNPKGKQVHKTDNTSGTIS